MVLASGGNISARTPDGDAFLVTGSGTWLDRLAPSDFAVVGLDGEHRSGPTPSVEWRLHLLTYLARPDVASVIHVHPQTAILLDALGHRIRLITSDHVLYLRRLSRVPFFPAGTPELADAVSAASREANCIVHGAPRLLRPRRLGRNGAPPRPQPRGGGAARRSGRSSWATRTWPSRRSGWTRSRRGRGRRGAVAGDRGTPGGCPRSRRRSSGATRPGGVRPAAPAGWRLMPPEIAPRFRAAAPVRMVRALQPRASGARGQPGAFRVIDGRPPRGGRSPERVGVATHDATGAAWRGRRPRATGRAGRSGSTRRPGELADRSA